MLCIRRKFMSFNYVSFAVMLLIAVASVIGGWKINQKARKPGWAAVVPLYGSYVLAEITWGEGWMFLLDLLPGSSIIYKVMTAIKLMNSFGYTGGKKVLFILGCIFFPFISFPIIGFNGSTYEGTDDRFKYQTILVCGIIILTRAIFLFV